MSQTKPLKLYFYANTFFCVSKPIWPVVTWMKTLYINHIRDTVVNVMTKLCFMLKYKRAFGFINCFIEVIRPTKNIRELTCY